VRVSVRPGAHRILLRAEILDGDERAVGHTLLLSATDAFLEIDRRPRLGSEVRLRLSFPRLFHSVEQLARVVAHVTPTGPGTPSGIEVEFVHTSAQDRARFAAVVAKLDRDAPHARAGENYRVLLVEDNPFIRDMFVYGVDKYFRTHQASVTIETADDGEAAWGMLSLSDYDLAIVDHYLPVLDGASLFARVRRESKLAGLPLIGVSVGGSDVRDAMLAAGADLFLGKPVVLRDLMRTLERLASAEA
jgi:CheY-like chemotaxis protein